MTGGALRYSFYPYQLAWLNDRARFKIGMWSRQVGKTFTTAFEIAEDMVDGLVSRRPAPWVMLSRGERQSAENLRQIKAHLKALGQAFEELESDFKVDAHTSYKALEIRMADDVYVIALPANPDTARGYSANIYLDEFAIHQKSREIWGALFPIISAGWKVRVTSTPKGKANKFYELMTADDANWSRHVVTIHQAVAQGLPRDIEELRAGLADEELWRQEFECEWLDEAHSWLPYELIMGCEHPDAGRPELYQGGDVYVGNDIARRKDLWVVWVFELVGDVLWCRELIARKGISFAEQDAILDRVMRQYRVRRGAMDATGMGEKPVEDAQRRHGSSRIEGVSFTAQRKLDLATVLKQRFEDRKIRIPEGDTHIRSDLHAVRMVQGVTGAPRLVADGETDGHADRFWAAALATGAADTRAGPFDFRSLGEPRAAHAAGAGGFSLGRRGDLSGFGLGG